MLKRDCLVKIHSLLLLIISEKYPAAAVCVSDGRGWVTHSCLRSGEAVREGSEVSSFDLSLTALPKTKERGGPPPWGWGGVAGRTWDVDLPLALCLPCAQYFLLLAPFFPWACHLTRVPLPPSHCWTWAPSGRRAILAAEKYQPRQSGQETWWMNSWHPTITSTYILLFRS